VSRGRGGTGGELAPSLLIAPRRRFVLIISGDIETNPGPQYGEQKRIIACTIVAINNSILQ